MEQGGIDKENIEKGPALAVSGYMQEATNKREVPPGLSTTDIASKLPRVDPDEDAPDKNSSIGLSSVEFERLLEALMDDYNKIGTAGAAAVGNMRKVCAIVDKLSKLKVPMAALVDAIHSMKDADSTWLSALQYTDLIAQIVEDVSQWAGKVVNGSEGDWCVELVHNMQELWESLIENVPSKAVREQVINEIPDFSPYEFDIDLKEHGDEEDEEGCSP